MRPLPPPPRALRRALPLALLLALGCRAYPVRPDALADGVLRVSLEDAGAGDEGFAALREAFARANPGYDLRWYPALEELAARDRDLVVFLQTGPTPAVLSRR